jgi:signal transduction histidine kinase
MLSSSFSKIFSALAVGVLLFLSVLGSFLGQDSQPSPTPSAQPSPATSPTPTPTRTPSPTPLPGAQNFHQWGSITVFNGLPSDSVRAIAQTPDGVMWFGTDNGLARFDGRRIQKISLGDAEVDHVLALETSNDGVLWIGTSSGAYLYAGDRFLPIDNTLDKGITTILIEGPDAYFGTDDGLVLQVNSGLDKPTARPLITAPITDPAGAVVAITSLVEARGQLLAGIADRGVFAIRDGAASQLPISPVPASVNAIAKTETGDLWLGCDAPKGVSGIYSSGGSGGKSQRITAATATVSTLEVSDVGGLWAGTERYGLFQIEGTKLKKSFTFANTSGGLRSDTIFTLFTDREGVLWIGTNRGASRYDRQGSFQETVSDIPNSNFIRALFRLPNRPMLAGSNRGLFEFDGEKWQRVPGFQEKAIYAISENEDGRILVGTSSGTFDLRGRLISSGDTRSIQNFRRTYAAVIGRGVVDLSSLRQDVVFPDDAACSLFAENDRLWIGTIGHGLFSFDGKSVRAELGPDVLKSGAIWNIQRGVDGNLWIAGQHGVFRLTNGQVERIVEVEDVRDVFVDVADVWAATTTRGLLHARHYERFGWLVTAIGFEQGLPSEKAFAIAVGQGLLIATNRGIVTYRPGNVPPKLIPVRILSQRVHDLAEAKSKIDLDYPQNSLLVEVAGQSSRTFPEEFQYAFVLTNAKGEELDRRISNESEYAPSDLVAGEYTIEAIAFNRDLLASEPLTIRFSVARAPFPWTATALGVLLMMALVALVWAVVEHRRIRQRNRELAAARLDLANEAERERRRIARDLHDQTLADLRNLMITSDKLADDNTEFRTEIEAVSTEIRRICEDLSPSVLENVGLVAALEFLLGHTVENHAFTADESVEGQIDFPLNVQLQIYRIAQEVLTNIVRHSSATIVEMTVTASAAGEFVLTVRDDGSTFQPDGTMQKGRGISNIRARANLINGKVAWKESRRGGNAFTLRIGPTSGAA